MAKAAQICGERARIGADDDPELLLTLFVSVSTLGSGRTTVLQGVVHLMIGGVLLLLSAVP